MGCKDCGGYHIDFVGVDYVEEYTDLKGSTEWVELWEFMCRDCYTSFTEYHR